MQLLKPSGGVVNDRGFKEVGRAAPGAAGGGGGTDADGVQVSRWFFGVMGCVRWGQGWRGVLVGGSVTGVAGWQQLVVAAAEQKLTGFKWVPLHLLQELALTQEIRQLEEGIRAVDGAPPAMGQALAGLTWVQRGLLGFGLTLGKGKDGLAALLGSVHAWQNA